jgi:hypothetical protein
VVGAHWAIGWENVALYDVVTDFVAYPYIVGAGVIFGARGFEGVEAWA